MMQLTCPQCWHTLDYASEPPRFCSNCGTNLSSSDKDSTASERPQLERTREFDPAAETLAPRAGSATALAAPPERIGGYRLGRRLGGGGMGSVHEAEHIDSGQRVAVKLIKPEHLSAPAIQRFRLEGRLASSVVH